jgi:cephalosporin hydroxylase
MTPIEQFIHDRDEQVRKNLEDRDLKVNTERYFAELVRTNYSKNFTWMGIPIIQCPSDLMVMQEIIWQLKPDYIIETGIAFGGMMAFYASVLQVEVAGRGKVLGVDIDPRKENRKVLERHPLATRMEIIKGSSTDPRTLEAVRDYCHPIFLRHVDEMIGGVWENRIYTRLPVILVSLDSCHSHDHVLQELKLYSPLVSVGSYIVVFDTAIELVAPLEKNRPWGKGNNPWTAAQEFMKGNTEFIVDREVEARAGVTAAPGGWLRRVR